VHRVSLSLSLFLSFVSEHNTSFIFSDPRVTSWQLARRGETADVCRLNLERCPVL